MAKLFLYPVAWSGGSFTYPISWGDSAVAPVVKNVSDVATLVATEVPLDGRITSTDDTAVLTATETVARNVLAAVVKSVSDIAVLVASESATRNILGGSVVVKNVSDVATLTATETLRAAGPIVPASWALFVDAPARVQLLIESPARMTGVVE